MAEHAAGAGARYEHPTLECDIVMKGGITSGVVYPGAVDELARRYRFRSIGGTSAGAIAAAIVAAAEHQRRRTGSGAGFARVEGLAERLAGPEGGTPLLLELFQPDRATRALFWVAMGFMKSKGAGALALLRTFPAWPLIALLLAAGAIVLSALGTLPAAYAVAAVALALALCVGGVAADVVLSALALRDNDFGLCTLGPESLGGGRPALTAWLHEEIQAAAGRAGGPVLTFADIWGVPAELADAAREEETLRRGRDGGLREVDLQMMTTDLTHGRPWRLPSAPQRYTRRLEQGGELLFDPAELRRFFPADVVAHLVAAGGDPGPRREAALAAAAPGRTFARFPIGPELPVLVATRMSLSFPVLISAVPLYQLDFGTDPPSLLRVVFSDGGISSNFPVHFFDAALPRRPTFGLHLTSMPPGVEPPVGADNQAAAVTPPPRVSRHAPEETRQIASLGQFFVAIKDAMQNWRDNAQARQPGFRDRVVHIALGPKEGGLNLTMERQKVLDLSARGGVAGRILLQRFGEPGPAGFSQPWNDHRFVRFRIAMAVSEEFLDRFATAYDDVDVPVGAGAITLPYRRRVAAGRTGPYYFRSARQLIAAQRLADDSAALGGRGGHLDRNSPRPPSTLRVVPPT